MAGSASYGRGRKLPEDEWIELARLAGILARFEQFFRAGPVVWPYLARPLREFHGDLNELAIELWQLLGYLFADTDDAYRIRQVGFGALRRRRSIFWPSQELINLLAGRPSSPIGQWRREFAGLLASCAPDRVAVVGGRARIL